MKLVKTQPDPNIKERSMSFGIPLEKLAMDCFILLFKEIWIIIFGENDTRPSGVMVPPKIISKNNNPDLFENELKAIHVYPFYRGLLVAPRRRYQN